MKHLFSLLFIICFSIFSCENKTSEISSSELELGDDGLSYQIIRINLPPGKKLINVNWRDIHNIWWLLEDMPEGYLPNEKEFCENNSDKNHSYSYTKYIFIEHSKE